MAKNFKPTDDKEEAKKPSIAGMSMFIPAMGKEGADKPETTEQTKKPETSGQPHKPKKTNKPQKKVSEPIKKKQSETVVTEIKTPQNASNEVVDKRRKSDKKEKFTSLLKGSIIEEMEEAILEYRKAIDIDYNKAKFFEEACLNHIKKLKKKIG